MLKSAFASDPDQADTERTVVKGPANNNTSVGGNDDFAETEPIVRHILIKCLFGEINN